MTKKQILARQNELVEGARTAGRAMTNDEIALQFPEWIKKLLPILGEIVKTIWKNGGCQAVKDFCKSKAGDICNLIPC